MAVGQHQWYHFWLGAPPSLVYFSGDWDVHWGYGILTHGHMTDSAWNSDRSLQGLSANHLHGLGKMIHPLVALGNERRTHPCSSRASL